MYCSRIEYAPEIKVVVAVPDFEVSTEKARAALPQSYPRADVVFNLQRVASLVIGLREARKELVNEGLRDRLHQPYRAHLVPGLEEVGIATQHNTTHAFSDSLSFLACTTVSGHERGTQSGL